ncbi:Conserved_hypothetical protein [Hexamita inflata]|uniref:Uncharacterized protein n=1 Tax=Hexamita inflata TaxID=28002 RepID=A0AA86PBA9_9EUKA|nr:Conserved hypothetical protein [Hexamita inflata]CAI9934596.1 Conserved hypothetical protein [Hexamita inflata]
MILVNILMVEQKSFKQCFSPASTIVGNRLTKTISLNLFPNPLMAFIPTDNMCQVLNGKQSTAFILLNSPTLGSIRLPGLATGISFTYVFNQNVTISHTFASVALYDQTLDATNGGFEILMDGEYQVLGSVADVMHTRSNQTSCFSQTRFVFDLATSTYGFEVVPVFCSLTSFDVFFEYYLDQKWTKIPVRAISSANPAYHAGDYSDVNSDFLQITRYLLDPTSASESAKYSDAERLAVQKMVGTLFADLTIQVRLSLEYNIKSTIGAITAVADYWFSMDPLYCADPMTLKATLNEGNIMFKTGFQSELPCLEVPSWNPAFATAQYLKAKVAFVQVEVLVQTIEKEVKTFERTIPFAEFVSLPYVKFSLEESEVRSLMDYNSTDESKIQMFVGLFDSDNNYLYDFTTDYTSLKRTCVQKRVIHFREKETLFALWTKHDSRCTSRTSKMTVLNYYGKTYNGASFENRQTYQVSVFVNYSVPVFDVVTSCDKDVVQTQSQCEANRAYMMDRKNRESMYYIVESGLEYNEIRYYAIETAMGIFKWSFVVFGLAGAAIVASVAFGLTISRG